MNYFFITGSSKGIGQALVEQLLHKTDNLLVGISRTNNLQHKNYKFVKLDLSKLQNVIDFNFPQLDSPNRIVLINNAGVIGDIKILGNKSKQSIVDTYNINIIAPNLLMNQFISQFQDIDCEKIILNISSGAGRHSVTSWSDYCASKAALDMCSLVVSDEQKNKEYPIRVISLAPGVIDTSMQAEIRAAKTEDFDKHDYFIALKKNASLSQVKDVAHKIIKILHKKTIVKEDVILDLRDL